MIRQEVLDLIKRVPAEDQTKIVLVLSTGVSVNLDIIARVEPNYLAVRGREAGSNDEGRAFFIPFESIALIKLEKFVRLNDFRAMYNEPLEAETGLGGDGPGVDPSAHTPAPAKVAAVAAGPADIAKQNLLDRIRAARTSAGARTIK